MKIAPFPIPGLCGYETVGEWNTQSRVGWALARPRVCIWEEIVWVSLEIGDKDKGVQVQITIGMVAGIECDNEEMRECQLISYHREDHKRKPLWCHQFHVPHTLLLPREQ